MQLATFLIRKPLFPPLQAVNHQRQIDLPWNSSDGKRKRISESFNIKKREKDMLFFQTEKGDHRHGLIWYQLRRKLSPQLKVTDMFIIFKSKRKSKKKIRKEAAIGFLSTVADAETSTRGQEIWKYKPRYLAAILLVFLQNRRGL